MTDIQLFQNDQFGQVRVIERDGEPWFVAKDVCECLAIINVSQACGSLDDDEKGISKIYTLKGMQDTSIISEPGLYSLVLRSNKPEAKLFKRWITHDVIPSIRKTGAYQLAPKSYAEALRALANEVEQKELAIAQRDEAIRTKYHFVEGRDAEMCGRVGGLTAQNERLREQIGDATNWKQAKAIPWLRKYFDTRNNGFFAQLGKILTSLSSAMGVDTRTIEDTNWGAVKTYHISVINRLREQLDAGEDILPKYRRWEQ
jgi:prophage antirepressor-like protein